MYHPSIRDAATVRSVASGREGTLVAFAIRSTMDSHSPLDRVQQGDAGRLARWGRRAARWAGRLLLAAGGTGLAGCVAEVAPAPVAPLNYYYYPYTYYDGHIVYHVAGNWYYPYGNQWYYYRRVPPGLAYHPGVVYQYRPPSYYRAPPVYRVAPPPRGYGGGPYHR
jgi:hypothetical protein